MFSLASALKFWWHTVQVLLTCSRCDFSVEIKLFLQAMPQVLILERRA
ncbi:hypothetical protein [Polaromonas sp. CG9_12]|nr:hypothetical protein [Polaromonas sp. CG9_12]